MVKYFVTSIIENNDEEAPRTIKCFPHMFHVFFLCLANLEKANYRLTLIFIRVSKIH